MLAKRLLTALGLFIIGIPSIFLWDGKPFIPVMGFFLVYSAWEYVCMSRAVSTQPSAILTVGGTALILLARAFRPEWAEPVFSILLLCALTWHMITFERGRDQAALDFAVTVGGLAYLGWIGAYLIDLRFLPNPQDGQWWLMIVLPSVWAADTAAYFVGIRWGRHRMSPRLSPKKSWEGYLGGVAFGTFIGGAFSWLWAHFFGLQVSVLQGAILGLVLSAVSPLGDLGESLFKRQAGLKDSSNIFPGHGGAFDRIDSWIWAGIIGVYMIRWFFL